MEQAETGPAEREEPRFFLEAHYYSDGLRHHAFALTGERPQWAPQADTVGFRGEFSLKPDVRVVEFSRRAFNGCRLSWLAVYEHSSDRKLGDRENYAGVGVWLKDLTVFDARLLLDSLAKFSSRIATGGDPTPLAGSADTFMRTYIPRYILPVDQIPDELAGCAFTERSFVTSRLYDVVSDGRRRPEDIAADQIVSLQLARSGKHTFSRALLRVGGPDRALDDGAEWTRLDQDVDVLADLVSDLPKAFSDLTTRARTNATDAENARSLAEDWERAASELQRRHERIREAVGLEVSAPTFGNIKAPAPNTILAELAAAINDLRSKSAEILSSVTRLHADRQRARQETHQADTNWTHDRQGYPGAYVRDEDYGARPWWFWCLLGAAITAFVLIGGYLLWLRLS